MATNYNLACVVHRHALTRPDAIAIVDKGRSVTYGELAERARRIAAFLKRCPHWQRDGIPPRVGILASRSIEACVALLGACWAGATYIPIGLKMPQDRILTVLSLCGLSAMIADEEGAALLDDRVLGASPPVVLHGSGDLESVANPETRLVDVRSLPPAEPGEPEPMSAQDTAYIIFTSGTTGVPKGVMISCGAIRHYIDTVTGLLGLRADDRAMESCELSFDVSLHNMFSTWQAGGSLHILPATAVMNAVKFVRNAGLTVWNSVPSLAGMLRQIKVLAPGSLPSIRVTMFGGEQLPGGAVAAWQAAAPNSAIHNLYGPTEATVFCLHQQVAGAIPLTPGRDVVAIGFPMPGNEAMVVDDCRRTVEDGTPGELALSGVQLSQGYLDAPDLTEARFPVIDGKRWYLTGDLAIRDTSGTFHCLGRIDNQIKLHGYRVELEEVDAHLRIASNVDVVGSVAWPLVDGAPQGIVSFIGAPVIDADRIIADLRAKLPAYMVPGRVLALDAIPLNQNGKVDRHALRRILAEQGVPEA
ncbi:MAG: amino acid adenylation domain-containing protein [Burkholderiaceae bacterium]